MAQYTKGTVSVTNGLPTVTLSPGVSFTGNVEAGNSFLVKGDSVVYTVAGVTSSTLTLSVNYQGVTGSLKSYQVTRDFTPNFGLAEISVGDQDWPTHLTQEVIRKIDSLLASKIPISTTPPSNPRYGDLWIDIN